MTKCSNDNRIIPAARTQERRKAKIDFKFIEVLVCLAMLVQYLTIIIFETGDIEQGTGLSGAFSVVGFLLYAAIFWACRHVVTNRQIVTLVACASYLILRTFVAGVGFVTMFNYLELVMAVVVFSRLKLPQKTIKHVCLFSVVLYLFILFTSHYEDAWLVNRVFSSTRINRNHFGILTVINMYMALAYLRRVGRNIRPSYVFVYVFGFAVILRSTSRTSLICVIIFILLHIIAIRRNPDKTKRLYKFFIISLLISVFAILFLTYVLPMVVGKDFQLLGRPILSGRDTIYFDALSTLAHDGGWLFGRGVTAEFTHTQSIFGTARLNSHNMWLQFTLNYGLAFTVPMVLIYRYSFRYVIGKHCDARAAMLTAMQILMFVYFLTEAPHFFRSYSCAYLVFYFTNGSLLPDNYRNSIKPERRVIQ